jgi:hypothetical protein
MFTIRIDTRYCHAGFNVLNVRRTALTPGTLLLVVDPKKTIRESLKDDGRFRAEVLTGRYTHLKCKSLVVPVDIPGEVLECSAEYVMYIKVPKGVRGLRSPRRRKRTSPEM